MLFDIRSLLVAVALASVVCALARYLLWRMHPTMPGLRHWMWAAIVGALALITYAGHGWIPGTLSLGLAQVFIAGGFLLAWDGFRRFLGRPAVKPQVLVATGMMIAAPIILSNAIGSMTGHTAINSAVIAVLSGLIARDLMRGAAPGRLAVRVTAWIYVANSLFFVVRSVSLFGDTPTEAPLSSDGVYAFSLLWWLGVNLGVTLGMALMAGERLQEELNHRANRDPLTGALNRRAFSLLAEKQMAHAARSGKTPAVLMMDLDHFKAINDQRGHASGDATLRHFVEVAGDVLRAEDILCRFGGEEFVALLPDASAGQAYSAAERLRLRFAAEGEGDTVSIGIAEAVPGESLEDLLRRADAALYAAKHQGRNRCEIAPFPTSSPPPSESKGEIGADG